MTAIDTSTEAVERLAQGLIAAFPIIEGYAGPYVDEQSLREDHDAASAVLLALLKERDEALARAAAAFEMAADLADTTFSCSGTDAAHIIRDAIRALPTDQERDALAKVRAKAMREAVAWFKPIEDAAGDAGLQERREGLRDAARAILARANQIEKGETE